MDDLNQQSLSSKFTGEPIYSIIQEQNIELQYSVFSFITDYRNTIEVIITLDQPNYISKIQTASIVIKSEKNVRIQDIKVRKTICHIIYSYISFNSDILYYYVADIQDDRQKARDRLFKSYFKLSCKDENLKMKSLNLGDVYMGTLYSTMCFSDTKIDLEISNFDK